MRNKALLLVSVLIVASMVLSACATPAAGTPQVITQIVAGTPQIVEVTPTPPPPATFTSKDPNTFVYATFGEPETLDPALDYETSGGGINSNVYETLVWYNKDKPADFIPQLASKWDISADGKTYTFTLQKGVKFQDGTDMTATDVAYSFWRGLLQGGTASPQWLLAEPFFGTGIDDVSVVVADKAKLTTDLHDDTAAMQAVDPTVLQAVCQQVKAAIVPDDAAGTVTMNLAQSWGPFLATIANTWGSVMSQKWVTANKGWDGSCDTWQNFYGMTSENDPLTSIAMGTGPFKLDHWTKGQEIVLTRNNNYWRTSPAWDGGPSGPAKIQTVIIKEVNEWGTRFSMMQAGDADFVTVNRQDVAQIDPMVGETCTYDNTAATFNCATANDQPFRLWIGAPTTTRTDVFMNFNISTEGGNTFIGSGKLDGNGIPSDFFADENVRKAFNYCFDWDTYIKDALVGEGIQSIGIPLPGMPGYDANGPKYTYDPQKCTDAFKASTLKSADGKSLWDIGFRFQIAYNTGNTNRQTVAEILATDLAAVNPAFQVEIIGIPWAAFLRAQRAKTLPVFISGWQEDIHDPHNWYVPYITGTYGGLQSLPADFTKQMGALLTQGVSESDPAKRSAIYAQVNQAMYDLAPDIILAIPTMRHYEQRWVNGYYYNNIYPDQYFYPLSKN